jgi:hypothetical protein
MYKILCGLSAYVLTQKVKTNSPLPYLKLFFNSEFCVVFNKKINPDGARNAKKPRV